MSNSSIGVDVRNSLRADQLGISVHFVNLVRYHRAIGAVKRSSITGLKRFRINITRRSHGIIGNMQQYKWKKSRDGETTNQPIDAFNHGIDAIRYVALKKLSVASHGTARAHVLRQR